jgi:hypothetical protein
MLGIRQQSHGHRKHTIHLLILADGQALVLNLDEHHQTLLELLGQAYEAFYLTIRSIKIPKNSISGRGLKVA